MEPITTILVGVCIGLGIGLLVLYSKYSSCSSQLEREKTTHTRQLTETQHQLEEEQGQTGILKGELTETQHQLEEEKQRTASLNGRLTRTQGQLKEEKRQTTSLNGRLTRTQGQLKKERRQTTSLKGELTETQHQLNEAEEQRSDLLQCNKKTRWILYLSMASLQGTGVTLLEEQKKMIDLREKHIGVIRNYKDLREDVKSKATRRLAKKAGEVILSFVPGLSMIPLLSDMGEILEAVSAADDVVGDLDEGPDIEGADTNVTLSTLTPRVRHSITDVLQQNMSMENADAELKSDAFNTFAVPSVRDTGNFIESELAEEYPESIRVTIDDLEEFIDEFFEYRQTMRDMKENPPPTEEGNLE